MNVPDSSRTSRATAGALASLLQYGLHICLQFALAPVVLKYAGRSVLGAYVVLTQAVFYIGLLDLGMGMALAWFLANGAGRQDGGERFAAAFATGRSFLLATNAVAGLALVLLAPQLPRLLAIPAANAADSVGALRLLGAWVVLRSPLSLYGTALAARQHLAAANLATIISQSGRVVLAVGLLWLGGGLVGLTAALIAAEASAGLACWFRYRSLYRGWRIPWAFPDRRLLAEMLRFGLRMALLNASFALVFSTDAIVVGSFFGASMAAVYYATYAPSQAGWQIMFKLTNNISPALTELAAAGLVKNMRSAYLRALRYVAVAGAVAGLGVLLFNRTAVDLWLGPKQYAGDLMTAALAVYTPVLLLNNLNASFVKAFGLLNRLTALCLVEGGLNLGASLLLAHAVGPQGVMLGTLVGCLLVTPGYFLVAWAQLELRPVEVLTSSVWPVAKTVGPAILALVLFACWGGTRGFWLKSAVFAAFGVWCCVASWKFLIDEADRRLIAGRVTAFNMNLRRLHAARSASKV